MRKCFIGFFGLNRSLRWTFDSIEKNVVGPLNAVGLKPLMAAHFNCPERFHSPRSGEFDIPFNTAGLEKLELELLWLEPQSDKNILADLPLVLQTPAKNEPDPDGTIRRNVLHQLHSLSRLSSLLDLMDPDSFELFCLLRADLMYLDPVPANEIVALIGEGVDIVTPAWQTWGGLNDRFAFCSRRGADVYLSRKKWISDLCRTTGTFQAESLLRLTVEKTGLACGLMGTRASRVRANGAVKEEDFTPSGEIAMVPTKSLLQPGRTLNAERAFHQAVALHDQGRPIEAAYLFEAVLAATPLHFGALCRLGVVRVQQLKFEDAAELFSRALQVDGNSAEAHQYLGFVLTGLERSEDAIRSYRTALAIRPDFPEAHNNLGHALRNLGRFDEAIANFGTAIALRAEYAEAHNNLGNALHVSGRSDQAIVHYENAIRIRPTYAEAYWNLGNALRALDRAEEAIAPLERALAIKPDYAEAYNSFGDALSELGRREEALAQFERAIAARPRYADAHIKLAEILSSLDRQEEAIRHFNIALEIRPEDVRIFNMLGAVLTSFDRNDEARTAFETSLSLDPSNAAATDALMRIAAAQCEWSRKATLAPRLAACVAEGRVVEPFGFLTYCSDPSLHLACAKAFIANEVPFRPKPVWNGNVWKNKKIRLAYLATGFHQHPAAHLTVELFELHDRSRFDVLGFGMGPDDQSEIRTRVIRAFDTFYDVRSKSDFQVAKILHDLQIDIAIDRTGYTHNSRPRIFAYRPAPIQVNYLGFPGTLGADFYDYVIADPTVLPIDQQIYYAEKIIHLPDCYQANDSKRSIAAETPTRQQLGLPAEGFVFCCFNNNHKITPQIYAIWMLLLQRVEGSVLWLLASNGPAADNLRKEAAIRGVDPGRIIFAERTTLPDHLARHRRADLFLDTLPYNAHTTASDALWAGLPIVTCYGEAFAGRVAASLLRAIGLPELVTTDLDAYETLALQLANHPSLLRDFRNRLMRNRLVYPLFDSRRYCRCIEAAYVATWELWQRGEGPRNFAVAAPDENAIVSR